MRFGPVRFTAVGDEWVGYRVLPGSDERTILYLPTLISTVDLATEMAPMESFLDDLSRFATAGLFDRRGTGVSDGVRDAVVPTLEDWADDAIAVLDAVGVERVTVLAYALGVAPALSFAAAFPSRVESLILVQGFARLMDGEGYDVGVPDLGGIDLVVNDIAKRWGEGSTFFLFHPEFRDDSDLVEHVARVERASFGRAAAARAHRVWLSVDVRDVIPAIEVPTLIMQGTALGSPVRQGRWLAGHLRDARLVEYDNEHFDWWLYDGREVALDAIEEFVTGAPARRPDRVLATVLFTDIVASTQHATDLGDRRWRDLLDRHRTTVRDRLQAYRGREINTRGDDVLATFDGPARAMRCAFAIDEAASALGLKVRSGIHTGEVEVMGDDIAGIAVHIGARIADLADTGEVLVSRTVVDLVAGSGISFASRGEHQLKGVTDTWQLFSATNT